MFKIWQAIYERWDTKNRIVFWVSAIVLAIILISIFVMFGNFLFALKSQP